MKKILFGFLLTQICLFAYGANYESPYGSDRVYNITVDAGKKYTFKVTIETSNLSSQELANNRNIK